MSVDLFANLVKENADVPFDEALAQGLSHEEAAFKCGMAVGIALGATLGVDGSQLAILAGDLEPEAIRLSKLFGKRRRAGTRQ